MIPITILALLVRKLFARAGSLQVLACNRNIMTTTSNEGLAPKAVSLPDGASNGDDAVSKLHGRAFYESIGSPKFVLAPMVDQSEFVSTSGNDTRPSGRSLMDSIGMAYLDPILHVA